MCHHLSSPIGRRLAALHLIGMQLLHLAHVHEAHAEGDVMLSCTHMPCQDDHLGSNACTDLHVAGNQQLSFPNSEGNSGPKGAVQFAFAHILSSKLLL